MIRAVEHVDEIAYAIESGLHVGKTIALFYGTELCPPCKMLKQWVAQNVREDVVLFVDVDKFPELIEENSLQSVPTVFLYRYDVDESGEYQIAEIDRVVGFDPRRLQRYLI